MLSLLKSLYTLLFRSSWREKKLLIKHYLTNKPVDGPEQAKEFQIECIDINLNNYNEKIENFSTVFDINIALKFKFNNKQYRIYDLHKKAKISKRKILVIAGMHGNETSGIISIFDILELIKKSPEQYKNLDIRILTPLNPVGVEYKSRFNEQGIDINRDFKRIDSPQSKLLLDITKEYSPDFVLNLHEGPQDGLFLYLKGKIDKELRKKLIDNLKISKIALAKTGYLKETLKTPGIIELDNSFYKVLMRITNLIGVGYYDDVLKKLEIPCITIEVPWLGKDKRARIRSHVIVFRTLCEEYDCE